MTYSLSHSPIDICKFTTVVSSDDDAVVVTSAATATLLAAGSSTSTFLVKCPTPNYTETTTVAATFDAKFEILEGVRPLPWDNGMTSPTIRFKTMGPVVSGISDVTMFNSYIVTDTTTYPNGRLSFTFTVTDADTSLSSVSLTFNSTNTDMVPVNAISATGEERGMRQGVWLWNGHLPHFVLFVLQRT